MTFTPFFSSTILKMKVMVLHFNSVKIYNITRILNVTVTRKKLFLSVSSKIVSQILRKVQNIIPRMTTP